MKKLDDLMLEDRTTRNFIRGKKGKTLGQKDPSAKSAKSNLEEQSNKRSKINEESQKKNQEFVQPFYFDTTPPFSLYPSCHYP